MEPRSRSSGRARPIGVRVLVVLGSLLAALGIVAGHANRNLLDGPTFADHVDEIRRDDAVAAALGRELAARIVIAQPDLVAVRPLVESIAIQVAGSERLSGPVRRAAREAHRVLTEEDAASIVLRLSDAGAVVAGVLASIAPERAGDLRDVSVTLASIGEQSFASTTIAATRTVGVLAWLLPLAALVCFGAAVFLARDRWRAGATVGRGLVAAAGVVALGLVVGGWGVRRLDDDQLGDAFVVAGWRVAVRPMWWSVALVALVGMAIVLAAGSAAPARLSARVTAARTWLLEPPSPWGVGVRAGLAALVGIAAVIDPGGLLESLAAVGGIALLLFALTELARLAARSRARAAEWDGRPLGEAPSGRRWRVLGPAAVGVAALVVGTVWVARPGDDVDPVPVSAGSGTVCNGHAELCERPFDEVAYVGSHNAMSVAREPGWFLAEQVDQIPIQLDQGVRALLVDVWAGRPAGTVVRTAEGSRAEAREIAERELGPDVVNAALRIADSIAGQAQGPEARYLCHGLCETGSTPFLDMLVELRGWLLVHPDEVVTLFIEDHVPAELIAADVEAAGQLPFIHQPGDDGAWPTLGEMIRSGGRLVVMTEAGRSPDHPWLLNGFDVTQDTPYTFPTVESFSCAANRGPADAPLFLLNHWLSGFSSLVTDAQRVNTRDVLLTRAEACRDERGQIPNFVAVNFVVIGDVFAIVDELNGVAS